MTDFHPEAELVASPSFPPTAATPFVAILALLGGGTVIARDVRSELDVHELIMAGMPRDAIVHLLEDTRHLRQVDVAPALGVSLRTLQRLSQHGAEPLTVEQSGRAWKLAEVLSLAQRVFGSRDGAEAWLIAPALALDSKRPIDLMASVAGTEMVEALLARLEYGVYT